MVHKFQEWESKVETVKADYPDLADLSISEMMFAYDSINVTDERIDEFLHTVPVQQVIKYIKKTYPEVEYAVSRGDELIVGTGDMTKRNIVKMADFISKFGWFPSMDSYQGKWTDHWEKDQRMDRPNTEIRFNMNYDPEEKFEKWEKYLFHITPDSHWEKIKKIGLTPKGKGRLANHPYRVYLMRQSDDWNLIDFAQLLLNTEERKQKIERYYVLRLNLDDLLKKGFKFYNDPDFKMGIGAVYTYKNIPPSMIEIYRTIDVGH